MPRHRAAIVAVPFLALLVAACGGGSSSSAPEPASAAPTSVAPSVAPPSSEPAASVSTGGSGLATTGRIEVVDEGFALTLPDGWTRVDLTPEDIAAIFEAAGESNEALVDAYSTQVQALLNAGLVLWAFGPDLEAGTNLNVLQVPGLGISLDLLEQLSATQLEAVAEGDVVVERVDLPAGEALHFRYQVAAEGLDEAPTIDQYLLLNGSDQLILSITSGPEGDAEAIAESVELLD